MFSLNHEERLDPVSSIKIWISWEQCNSGRNLFKSISENSKKKKKDGRGKKKNGQFCIRETGSGKEDKEIEKGKEEEEEE